MKIYFNPLILKILFYFIKDYFLFPHIGRMDDFGLILFTAFKYKVVYNEPTFYQKEIS